MTRTKRKLLALTIVVLGIIVASATAAVGPWSSSSPSSTIVADAQAPPAPVAMARVIDAQLAQDFAVFRKQRNDSDELPANARRSLEQASVSVGANPELARRLTERGSHVLYATAGSDAVCTTLVDETGAGTGCVPEAAARAGETVGTTLLVDGVVVNGMVPDGVASVDITLADSSVVHAPVVNNGYVVKVTQAPKQLSYAIDGQTVAIDVPYAAPDAPVVEAR